MGEQKRASFSGNTVLRGLPVFKQTKYDIGSLLNQFNETEILLMVVPAICPFKEEARKLLDEGRKMIEEFSVLESNRQNIFSYTKYLDSEESTTDESFARLNEIEGRQTSLSQNLSPMLPRLNKLIKLTLEWQNTHLKQVSTDITVNGILVSDNARTVTYSDISRSFTPGSECWQIIYACSKPTSEGRARLGEADVDEVLFKLNELAAAKKKSAKTRNDIHRLINQINSKWAEKGMKVLHVDSVMNSIVLKPIKS